QPIPWKDGREETGALHGGEFPLPLGLGQGRERTVVHVLDQAHAREDREVRIVAGENRLVGRDGDGAPQSGVGAGSGFHHRCPGDGCTSGRYHCAPSLDSIRRYAFLRVVTSFSSSSDSLTLYFFSRTTITSKAINESTPRVSTKWVSSSSSLSSTSR